MPVFKNRTVVETVRNITAFFNLEVGLTRGKVPAPHAWQEALSIPEQGAETEAQDEVHGERSIEQPHRESGVDPAHIIWIFGAGRTGSTWLANMMNEMPRTMFWNEPMVGNLFGNFRRKAQGGQLNSRGFILGDPAKESWVPLVRDFILKSVNYRFPRLGPEGWLVIKEPNSSMGAPIIMEALPESSMVFLIRDPRDVVASALDGSREGGWLYSRKRGMSGEESLADEDPDTFARNRARQYLNNITGAREAFEAHLGNKTLVRYEELRTDTFGTMKRIYSELGIPVSDEKISRAVEKHAWENIPEENKGEGKKFRKATPGGWSEDLTPGQVKVVEKVTGPILREFYPDNRSV